MGFELIVQWTVFLIVVAIMASRRQLTIFHPTSVYLAFHAIVFCIRPTLVYIFEFDSLWIYMKFTPTDEVMVRTLYLSSAGLIAFCVTFLLTSKEPGPKEIEGRRELLPGERKAFFAMALIMAPLGIYSITAANMQGEHINGVYVMTGTSGYINDLQQVLIPITIFFLLVSRWKWYAYLPLIIFFYYRATQGWGRWTIILTFFALILVHAWQHRKNFPALKFVLPIPVIAILFANLGLDRAYMRNLISGNHEDIRDVLSEEATLSDRLDTMDFANFDYLTYIVDKVPKETETYTYGTQYLQIFTEPIPRKIWKSKPIGPPVSFFNLNDYGNFLGLTPSLVGDGWMSGGWIGSLLTMSLAGWALGLLYNWFIRNQQNIFYCFIFLIVNAMIVQLYRDGGISIAKFLLFTLSPIFLWMFFSKYLFPDEIEEEDVEDDEYDDWEDEDEYLDADESDEPTFIPQESPPSHI